MAVYSTLSSTFNFCSLPQGDWLLVHPHKQSFLTNKNHEAKTAVIQVSMDGQRNFFCMTEGEKARRKAMKIAVGLSGVESSALKGKNGDQIEVKGDNIDTVKLATLLRKKVGHASIVSVAEEKKEEKKKDEPKIQCPYGPPYTFYEIRDPCYDTNVCSIL